MIGKNYHWFSFIRFPMEMVDTQDSWLIKDKYFQFSMEMLYYFYKDRIQQDTNQTNSE